MAARFSRAAACAGASACRHRPIRNPAEAGLSSDGHPTSPPLRRLKTRREFLAARQGPSQRRATLVVQARARGDGDALIGAGYTATKKIGTAVVRNRAKRRLRAAAREILPRLGLPGTDYVFIARATTATAPWARLLDDMENALISLAPRLGAWSGQD